MLNSYQNKSLAVALALLVVLGLSALLLFAGVSRATDDQKSGKEATVDVPNQQPVIPGFLDEYNREVPRTTVSEFIKSSDEGDFQRAAEYLDLRNLPRGMSKTQGPDLARKFRIVMDRAFDLDAVVISDDPKGFLDDDLPPYRDIIGRIKTPDRVVDIMLQRVPLDERFFIWKFSNKTVAQIPHLYKYFGLKPFEEALSKWFPDILFLGWQLWQWAALIICTILAYIAAFIPTALGRWILMKKRKSVSQRLSDFGTAPVRILLWLFLVYEAIEYIGPSVTLRTWLRHDTLAIVAVTWAATRLVDLGFAWWADRLQEANKDPVIVLLKPIRTFVKITVILLAALVWLGNLGFDIKALLAGLGVGGIAVALAVQDTLKNFIASIMILLDKPYTVGQRIIAKGLDGVVEEIGLRSTRLRLLNGHQATIPNDQIANTEIENIGRRPYIRRIANIAIRYNTPLEKIQSAVNIIQDILDSHEGMEPDLPPRVFFNEFNRDSLNITVIYFYHPPDYWTYLAFNQKVNTQIMDAFEKEDIRFALPSTTTYLTEDDFYHASPSQR